MNRNDIKQIGSLAGIHFRQWSGNWRIRILFLLVVLLLFNFTKSVRSLTSFSGIPVSPWILIPCMSTYNTAILILLGYVLLYCDAPFIDEKYPYIMIRSGRWHFAAAQMLYIALSSALYIVFVLLVSLLCCLPNLSFSLRWGKVIQTIALREEVSGLTMRDTLLQMQPIHAALLQFLLLWLVGCWIGLLLFCLNLYFSRAVGIGVATALIFANMFADFYIASHTQAGGTIYYFLPTSWANLGTLHAVEGDRYPPFLYALLVLLASSAVFIFLIFIKFRHEEVEVVPSI